MQKKYEHAQNDKLHKNAKTKKEKRSKNARDANPAPKKHATKMPIMPRMQKLQKKHQKLTKELQGSPKQAENEQRHFKTNCTRHLLTSVFLFFFDFLIF